MNQETWVEKYMEAWAAASSGNYGAIYAWEDGCIAWKSKGHRDPAEVANEEWKHAVENRVVATKLWD